jgi:ferredoxin
MYEKVVELFEVPAEAVEYVPLFLRNSEIQAIERMGRGVYPPAELAAMISDIADDPDLLISEAYSRAVFDKAESGEWTGYTVANFYRRLAYFAQYEPEIWKSIPEERRREMDEWYVRAYAEGARPRLEEALKDGSRLIENAFFFTLEETMKIIDNLEDDAYMVPCNCKSVALNCDKPKDVCILFSKGINSEWDRGHGKPLTKNEAKELIRFANRNGLMQTSEMEMAICSCDACCCYPVRASKMIGAKGLWPKQVYTLAWNGAKCIHCGKCAKMCNFGAFKKTGERVEFDGDNCWGCTICGNYCPVNAITFARV